MKNLLELIETAYTVANRSTDITHDERADVNQLHDLLVNDDELLEILDTL